MFSESRFPLELLGWYPLVKRPEVLRLDGDSDRVVHTWRSGVSVPAESFDAMARFVDSMGDLVRSAALSPQLPGYGNRVESISRYLRIGVPLRLRIAATSNVSPRVVMPMPSLVLWTSPS